MTQRMFWHLHTYTKSNDKTLSIVGQQRRHSTWFKWHCWIAVVLHPCNNHFYVGRIIFNAQGARWGNHPPRNIKQLVHARNLNPTPKSWSNYLDHLYCFCFVLQTLPKYAFLILQQGFADVKICWDLFSGYQWHTVDGRNPAPPEIQKTL